MMPTLIFGKPFTVTEFNYVCPNHVFEAANDPLAQLSERLTELKQSGTLPLLVRRTSVIIRLHGAAGCIVTALSASESTP